MDGCYFSMCSISSLKVVVYIGLYIYILKSDVMILQLFIQFFYNFVFCCLSPIKNAHIIYSIYT